jgi:hypothetical protein
MFVEVELLMTALLAERLVIVLEADVVVAKEVVALKVAGLAVVRVPEM